MQNVETVDVSKPNQALLWWRSPVSLKAYLESNSWHYLRQSPRIQLTWLLSLIKVLIFIPLLIFTIHLPAFSGVFGNYMWPLAFLVGVISGWPELYIVSNNKTARAYSMPLAINISSGLLVFFASPLQVVLAFGLGNALILFLKRQHSAQIFWNTTNYIIATLAMQAIIHALLAPPYALHLSIIVILLANLGNIALWILFDAGMTVLDVLNSGKKMFSANSIWQSNTLALLFHMFSWTFVAIILYFGPWFVLPLLALLLATIVVHTHSQAYLSFYRLKYIVNLGLALAEPIYLETTLAKITATFNQEERVAYIGMWWHDKDYQPHSVGSPESIAKTVLDLADPSPSLWRSRIVNYTPPSIQWGPLALIKVDNQEVGGIIIGYNQGQVVTRTIDTSLLLGQFANQISAILTTDTLEQKRRYLSTHDALTGNLNESAFFASLDDAINQNARPIVVAMLDIDNFKSINDTYGHATGDQAILEVSKFLQKVLPPNATLSRLHGDEFAWWHLAESPQTVAPTYRSLEAALKHIEIPGNPPFVVSASIGVSVALGGGNNSAKDILVASDQAMYRHKKFAKQLA